LKEALIYNQQDELPKLSLAYRDLLAEVVSRASTTGLIDKALPEALEGNYTQKVNCNTNLKL
jgi:hypothetical protein